MKAIKLIVRFTGYVMLLAAICFLVMFIWVKYVVETKLPQEATVNQFADINNKEEISYSFKDNQATDSIVFVGGLSGWSGTWSRTINALEDNLSKKGKNFNYIAIDLPPFGFSKVDLERGFYRKTQAARLNEFLESKDLKNVIFVAHSYGAGPVMEAIMNQENRVKKVVIIDGVLNINETKTAKKIFIFEHPKILETLISIFGHVPTLIKDRLASFVYQKGHIDVELAKLYMQPFILEGTSRKLAIWLRDYMYDDFKEAKSVKSENYQKLNLPVRVIWGDKDTLTPVALSNKITAPNKKTYILHEVGHIPMIEDYDQFDRAILEAIIE